MVNDTDSSLVVKSKCGGAWFGLQVPPEGSRVLLLNWFPLCLIHDCHYVPSLSAWEFFSLTSSGFFVSYDPCLPFSKLIFIVVEDILQEFPETFCIRVNIF